jgi:hypothetical protein
MEKQLSLNFQRFFIKRKRQKPLWFKASSNFSNTFSDRVALMTLPLPSNHI